MKIMAARRVPSGNAIRQAREASRTEFSQRRPTRGSRCQSVAKMRMSSNSGSSNAASPRLLLANLLVWILVIAAVRWLFF